MENLYSVQIVNSINLRQIKSRVQGLDLVGENSMELFYKSGNKFLSIYSYGGISFVNYSETERVAILNLFENKLPTPNNESIQIDFKEVESYSMNGNDLSIPNKLKSDSIFRIVMFDISQSVSLDSYQKKGDALLDQINAYAKELETSGDLDMSKKEIMKFIGKSLVIKNSIADTLYIFDSPDLAWEDENVDKLHHYLSGALDLKSRYSEIDAMIKVVDDNLDVFRDIYQQKNSYNLEIVVIILIAIEILIAVGGEILKMIK